MKFWKLGLLTTAIFSGIIFTLLLVACEKNPCDGVSCQHGGSCNAGICNCPTGYEGAQCENLSTARYVGKYSGYTQCDNLAPVIDSVTIATSLLGLQHVDVKLKSIGPKILHGIVSGNASTYSILVTNNDTIISQKPTDTSYYFRTFTITLQSDKMLSIHSYEILNSPTDTVVHKCNFLSVKKY